MKNRFSKNLMQKALDGTLDDHKRKTWNTLLQSNPDLRNEFEVQEEMMHLLQEVAYDNPPDSLTHDIMRAVQISKRERVTWRQKISTILVPSVHPKYIYSFAAGLAFGLLMLVVLPKNTALLQHPNPSHLSGTLQVLSRVGKTEMINLQQMQGKIAWIYEHNAVDIQLDLNPRVVSMIQFEYPKDEFFLKNLSIDHATLFNALNVTSEMTTFQIKAPCKIQLAFSCSEEKLAPILFQIKQNNEIVFSRKIQ
jgi:hypothetical protein